MSEDNCDKKLSDIVGDLDCIYKGDESKKTKESL